MLLPLNRALACWESSLPSNSVESGCISPLGIIPAEQFCRIRMQFSGGNHPYKEISSNQDEFPCWESSLLSNSVESGCISLLEIIPAQKFLQNRMQFSGGNHPCLAILSNQDEFSRRESSLPSNSIESGCISPDGNHLRQAIPPGTGASLTNECCQLNCASLIKSGAGFTTTSGTGWG